MSGRSGSYGPGRSACPEIRLTRMFILISCVVIHIITWEFVGYLLGKGPDLPPINIKGYGRLRTPEHIPIESITLFTFPALGVDVA
jgi:hypothetical protein